MSYGSDELKFAVMAAIDRLEFARHCVIQARRGGDGSDEAYRVEKQLTDALVALHWLVSDMNGLSHE